MAELPSLACLTCNGGRARVCARTGALVSIWESLGKWPEDEVCSVCMEWIGGGGAWVAACAHGHAFHTTCLKTWADRSRNRAETTCPECRMPLLPGVITELYGEAPDSPAPPPATHDEEWESPPQLLVIAWSTPGRDGSPDEDYIALDEPGTDTDDDISRVVQRLSFEGM